jgi:hypothetical protein
VTKPPLPRRNRKGPAGSYGARLLTMIGDQRPSWLAAIDRMASAVSVRGCMTTCPSTIIPQVEWRTVAIAQIASGLSDRTSDRRVLRLAAVGLSDSGG